jgi:hypothetical protein
LVAGAVLIVITGVFLIDLHYRLKAKNRNGGIEGNKASSMIQI